MMRLLLFLLLVFAGQAYGLTTVVIDAGHGGHDRGGVPGQRISEKVLTLDVARRVNAILRARGLQTVMTRSNDTFIPLPRRVAIGNARRNAIFVSIHFNSAPREGARGFETYYYSRASRGIATRIQRRLLRTCATENRGVKQRGYFVLRRARIPAVLVECGFLSNRREGALCLMAAHRQRLAEAIAQGILDSR